MYIEFELRDPNKITMAPGQAAGNALHIIKKEMQAWSKRYGIPYREKSIKYQYRVTFDKDQTYSFWAMTWNVNQRYHATTRYRIVSDLNNKI